MDFGIADLDVPPLALGTMYFGTTVPRADALACLDEAFELGARFWDTANNYAFWAGGTGDESESTIGAWLAARGPSAREAVVLATKIGARPRRPGSGLSHTQGLSRTAIREQVAGSLRRLGVDDVDVLYAHIDDHDVPLGETLGALGELVDEGWTRQIAASNLTPDRLREAMTTPAAHSYAALQQRFTYLRPEPGADLAPHVLLDDDCQMVCMEQGLTMLGYSPLLSGAYTRPDRPLPTGYSASAGALTALRDVASAHSLDAGQAVLAWMTGRHMPVLPVVGVSSPRQVRSAWAATMTRLDPDELLRLENARDR